MVRRGFPFNHIQLSFAQWLAARTTMLHPEPIPVVWASRRSRETRFNQPTGIGAFKPKILSMIQPNTILQGHRWENYRVVDSSGDASLDSEQHNEDDVENSYSSSLSIEDMQMFLNRRNTVDNEASISSGNTLSSLSSLLSEEGADASEFPNNNYVLRDSMGSQDGYLRQVTGNSRQRMTLPVLPPPYPYPEDPPPTYEEAILSHNQNNDNLITDEVALTLAELDSVLSSYPTYQDDWCYGLQTSASTHLSEVNDNEQSWGQTVHVPSRNAGHTRPIFVSQIRVNISADPETMADRNYQAAQTSVKSAQNDDIQTGCFPNAAESATTVTQGVQTDGNLLSGIFPSDIHCAVSESAQNVSNENAQALARSESETNTIDSRPFHGVWENINSHNFSNDIDSTMTSYPILDDTSFAFQDRLSTSYQLSNNRDMLY